MRRLLDVLAHNQPDFRIKLANWGQATHQIGLSIADEAGELPIPRSAITADTEMMRLLLRALTIREPNLRLVAQTQEQALPSPLPLMALSSGFWAFCLGCWTRPAAAMATRR